MPKQQPYFQSSVPITEFSNRRWRVADMIGNGAVAVLQGAPVTGSFDVFRQTNEFYYLSGVEIPHAYLLINGSGSSVLYLPSEESHHDSRDSRHLHSDDPEAAQRVTGIGRVMPLEALADDLKNASVIFTPFGPAEGFRTSRDVAIAQQKLRQCDPWRRWRSTEEQFCAELRSHAKHARISDLTPILDTLRMTKSSYEIEAMRTAGSLSGLAITSAMRCTFPGLKEYHLAASAEYTFVMNGARGGAYAPIVASGGNIWNAHYCLNNRTMEAGELVLMDYAPDYGYYTSDIARIWPVSGKYSGWQRELYGFIVKYHKTLLAAIRPGLTAAQILSESAARMERVVESTRWSKPAYQRAALKSLAFRGHLSHSVGMAVHDAGDYREHKFSAGMVFSVDPQMWIPEEHLYIRVEDTVLVTPTGIENLTARAPLELNAVERLMARHGTKVLPPVDAMLTEIGPT